MQHLSPDGSQIASLDPSRPAAVISDAHGVEQRTIGLGPLGGIAGFRWLASGLGLAVWTLDELFIVPIDGDGEMELAYAVEQPGGKPLAIEDVRAIPGGLLVVAQACSGPAVVREATVVHLDGTTVHSQTSLEPWSGVLYAATAFDDGRIVLALNEPEHFQGGFLQCVAREARESRERGAPIGRHQLTKDCWYLTLRNRFFASEFRVLRVHRPDVVEVVGSHRCPRSRGCLVRNWATSPDELLWSNDWAVRRLRSPVSADPLMPTGGVWTRHEARAVQALWVRGGRVLATDAGSQLSVSDVDSSEPLQWQSVGDRIFSARFRPDGAGAILALRTSIVDFDFETGRSRELFARLDVPAAFDARYESVHFSDAAVTPSGALTFDVTGTGRRTPRAHVTVGPGMGHSECRGGAVSGSTTVFELMDDPVAHYRKRGHVLRDQTR